MIDIRGASPLLFTRTAGIHRGLSCILSRDTAGLDVSITDSIRYRCRYYITRREKALHREGGWLREQRVQQNLLTEQQREKVGARLVLQIDSIAVGQSIALRSIQGKTIDRRSRLIWARRFSLSHGNRMQMILNRWIKMVHY